MRFRVGETEDIFGSRPVRTQNEQLYANVGPERIYNSWLNHVNYPEPDEAAEMNSDERDFYHAVIGHHPNHEDGVEQNLLELYRHTGSWFGGTAASFQWMDAVLENAAHENGMEHKLDKLVKAGYLGKEDIGGEQCYFPQKRFADEEMRRP